MYHSLFIHSLTEGYLSFLQVLAIMNKAVLNIYKQVFVCTEATVHKVAEKLDTTYQVSNKNVFNKYQGVWLLAHMVRVCLVL